MNWSTGGPFYLDAGVNAGVDRAQVFAHPHLLRATAVVALVALMPDEPAGKSPDGVVGEVSEGCFGFGMLLEILLSPVWFPPLAILSLALRGLDDQNPFHEDGFKTDFPHALDGLIFMVMFPVFILMFASIGMLTWDYNKGGVARQGMQVTAAGAMLTSLGWLLQLCKLLPAASKGRFAVVRVVAVAAAALAPIIACSVATATVLATSPNPNPYLGIERIERAAFAPGSVSSATASLEGLSLWA